MVAVAPHAPATADGAIDRPGDANRQPLQTTREARRLVCLHHQMQMIGLDGELQDTEARRGRRRESAPDGREESRAAQRRNSRRRAERGVRWAMNVVWRATAMRRRRSPARRALSSGARTRTAPRADHELELSRYSLHLD
jgi:hypothetical protein